MPRVQLNVQPLSDYSSAKPYSGSVYDSQRWNGIGSEPVVLGRPNRGAVR